ncbi:MAG: hypothetical protein AB1486_19930 [Planctomycetota bacterium]
MVIKRNDRRPAATLLKAALSAAALLVLGACASEPVESASVVTAAQTKRHLMNELELRINAVVRESQPRFDAIRDDCKKELAGLETPVRLQVIDAVLGAYGEAEERAFRDAIDAVVERAKSRTNSVLEETTAEIRRQAYEVAGTDAAAEPEFATGYDDLDAMVEGVLDRLKLHADLPGLEDLGYFRRGEVVRLPRLARVDKDACGRLSVFVSPPLPGRKKANQETPAVVVTFQKAPELEASVPIRLVQAVRHRIVRGGVPVEEKPWRLDPGTPDPDQPGVLPLDSTVGAPGYYVSGLAYPAVDSNDPAFAGWRDHTFEYEYETAVQRTDSGEILVGLGWELRWQATHTGKLLLESSPLPRERKENFVILERLLR